MTVNTKTNTRTATGFKDHDIDKYNDLPEYSLDIHPIINPLKPISKP